MLDHRIHVLLDGDRYRRVCQEAKRRRTSVGALIREAIDREIPEDNEERLSALDAILASEPIPVPEDPSDLRKELDQAHDRLSS